ncbi:squalene-hopene cyclase [Schizosaccharomyces japonicus yFS275]|uniref:Squalene-hopene cyclase n=1 Tax=Schizosaccharomyces japonicus (strain yFS275 / FY16936) TaxID=402676 RepID=SHC1_SCHJY|nr:squalene-hopene cyclase [Schizosaccharomyces japonicus yFS275]B6K412.1 RecName: Full=Squalene-hopene cyclase; Short=SHC [Schizosaccharomyces japonicus yFS275]EEB08219.1 squalene-hopene cyclase [Schizosaccharomyces japonicus yFS275]
MKTDGNTTLDTTISMEELERTVKSAYEALAKDQQDDGHWIYELEADVTIPAQFILLEHTLDKIDEELEQKIANYLRRCQSREHWGWPVYYGGEFNISASVQAYFALKMTGEDINAPHMVRAREAILAHGGPEYANVFTRIQLSLFGEASWLATPFMPVEIMLLPRWMYFSIWNMSYWSRTTVAPLLIVADLKPKAINPRNVHIPELFPTPPDKVKTWIHGPFRSKWGHVFKFIDTAIRPFTRFVPSFLHKKAYKAALDFIEPRLNGVDGLGAIYPPMSYSAVMYRALGIPDDDPRAATNWEALKGLLVIKEREAYCQACVSPVWDTALSGHALMEASFGPDGINADRTEKLIDRAAHWLRAHQVLNVVGDWAINNPNLQPGGWAFQYGNDYYPDVDDTAVAAMLLHRQNLPENEEALDRARKWIIGMQSSNGGWGAFDIDNDKQILNDIPFADHGALLDPPTADVSARCISLLAELGHPEDRPVIERGIKYLRKEQEEDGSWFGRWGTNYIYGAWSVLCAFNASGVPHDDPSVLKCVNFLKSVQREDGGWGESCETYEGSAHGVYTESLPSQTAWAVLGLMASGRRTDPAVKRGIVWLIQHQQDNGEWAEEPFNAVGFPRMFYLHYLGYKQFFPLLALARYRHMEKSGTNNVSFAF